MSIARPAAVKTVRSESQASNHSIERTALSQLRWPKSTAHVER